MTKWKRPLPKSPSNDVQTICPICLEVIVDSTDKKEGQDAIYCISVCNSWIRRQCAGLSQALYKLLEQSDDPFYCPHALSSYYSAISDTRVEVDC